MARSRATIGWLLLALAVVLIDQLTKALVEQTFRFGERRTVIPGWFDLTLVYNKGAAFSFLSSADGWQRWFFIALGTVAAVVIVFMLVRHGSQRLFGFGLAMILGGAVGNVIDRVWRGQVVDFLLFHHGDWYFPAFNAADSAITLGAALLILDELLRVRRSR